MSKIVTFQESAPTHGERVAQTAAGMASAGGSGRVCAATQLPAVINFHMNFHMMSINLIWNFGVSLFMSMDWFKGKSTGNHRFSH